MGAQDADSTRERILTEAMRLFGENGFAATTVAEIESAAGLSGGSGGLYRHFPSKRELLAEGVRRQIDSGEDLVSFLGDRDAVAALPARQRIAAIARAGLARLDQERDLTRLLVRDLPRFPELVEQVREQDVQRVNRVVSGWLAGQPGAGGTERDWQALTAVLVGALVHYWIVCDIFGSHPDGVDMDRFVQAFADLVVNVVAPEDA